MNGCVDPTQLRGRLPRAPLGARGIEHFARNPSCATLAALIAGSVSPIEAAAVAGYPAREGQSPFAISVGDAFEQRQLENGAARLLDLYRSAGRLSASECRVVNVADLAPGTRPRDLIKRLTLTLRFLMMKVAGDPNAPNIIVHPRLEVPLLGETHTIEPDYLVAADADRFYRPGEVKSYPDRGGKTDGADTVGACRQAAVTVFALRGYAPRLRIADPDGWVPATCDLVLRWPGSGSASLRPMKIESEVDSICRAVAELPDVLGEAVAALSDAGLPLEIDSREALDALPNHFVEGCREHCALAAACRARALRNGDPALLGSTARELLRPAGSIDRALQLLYDPKATPRTPEEAALQADLRYALTTLKHAVRHAG